MSASSRFHDQPCHALSPAIIDHDTFKATQQRATDNQQRAKRNGKYEYLFTGRLTCKQCGYAMTGHKVTRPKQPNYLYVYYRHSRKLPASVQCSGCSVVEKELDAVLWRWIADIASHPETVEEHLAARREQAEEHNKPLKKRLEILEREIKSLNEERDTLQLMLVKGKLTGDFYDTHFKRVEKQIAELLTRRAEIVDQIEEADFTPEQLADVREFCAMIREGLKGLTREERKLAYELSVRSFLFRAF